MVELKRLSAVAQFTIQNFTLTEIAVWNFSPSGETIPDWVLHDRLLSVPSWYPLLQPHNCAIKCVPIKLY